ncbi:MAG: hypothetical protein ACK4Z8_01865 [Novosphingobium sp.]
MNLKSLLESTMKDWEWEDEVETNDDGNVHTVATPYVIDGNSYRMFLEGHDRSQLIKMYLYSPVSIPEKRHDDACVVLNRLNKNVYSGFLDLIGENVRYLHVVDVEGCEPEVQLVSNMRASAGNAFRPAITQALGALAFTKLSPKEIIAQYEAPDDEAESTTD